MVDLLYDDDDDDDDNGDSDDDDDDGRIYWLILQQIYGWRPDPIDQYHKCFLFRW